MTQEQRVLKLAALCLRYPESDFAAILDVLDKALPELPDATRLEFGAFLQNARTLRPLDLATRYSRAFDFDKEQALYLTFHELGESNDRAAALLELKETIEAAGFLCPAGELPDYIPLLLEFLAEKPEQLPDGGLALRLARVLKRIADSLATKEPLYAPVFRAVLEVLPDPGENVGASRDTNGGASDSEETNLPYPLEYL